MKNILVMVMGLMMSVAAMAVTYPTYRPSTPQFGGGRSADPDRVSGVVTTARTNSERVSGVAMTTRTNSDRVSGVMTARTDNSLDVGRQYHSPYNTLSFPTYSGDLAVPMGGNGDGYTPDDNSGNGSNGGNARRGNARRAGESEGGYCLVDGVVYDESTGEPVTDGYWDSDGYYHLKDGTSTGVRNTNFDTQGDLQTPMGNNLLVLLMMALAYALSCFAYNWKKEEK